MARIAPTALRTAALALAFTAAGAVSTPVRAAAAATSKKPKKARKAPKKKRTEADGTAPADAKAAQPQTRPPAETDAQAAPEATAPEPSAQPGTSSETPPVPEGAETPASPAAPEATAPEPPAQPEPTREAASGIDPALARQLLDESEAVRDAIFRSRAAIATATRHLEPAQVELSLRTNLPRFYTIENFVVTVDGAPVVVLDKGLANAGDPLATVRASPGVHRLGVSMDLTARRNPDYRLSVAHRWTFEILPDRDAKVRLVLRELGNLWRLGKRRRGVSRWLAFVRVRATKRGKGARRRPGGAPAAAPKAAGAKPKKKGAAP